MANTPGLEKQYFATTAKFSALDIHYHSTQYVSSLQVLVPRLWSGRCLARG